MTNNSKLTAKKREPTAKDLAFQRKTAKYCSTINQLKKHIDDQNKQIYELNMYINDAENKINELQDWVNRLLKCMDMSEQDVKNMIQREKESAKFAGLMDKVLNFSGMFY